MGELTGLDLLEWLTTLTNQELDYPINVDGCQFCIHPVNSAKLPDDIPGVILLGILYSE